MKQCVLLTILLLCVALDARAQTVATDSTTDPDSTGSAEAEADEQAQRLFGLGNDAFDAERYPQAAVYFSEAYALAPRPELLFNAGAAYQRAGADREAIETFEAYRRDHPDGPQLAEVETRLRVLRIGVAPASESETPEPETESADPGGFPTGAVVSLTSGVAALAVGTVMLVLGGQAQSNVEDARGVPYSTVADDADKAKLFGIIGGSALALGGVLVGLGVVLLTTRSDGEQTESSLAFAGDRITWSTRW